MQGKAMKNIISIINLVIIILIGEILLVKGRA